MDKTGVAKKLIKLLNLYNDSAATEGEKSNALNSINNICTQYHLRIDGVNIIDTDIEEENKKKLSEKNITQEDAPDKYNWNRYVMYKGKKYYGRVPRNLYQKEYKIPK